MIANELEILGSHGMQAHRYDAMLAMIQSGKLAPEKLIGRRITLEESVQALINMDKFEGVGVTVVTEWLACCDLPASTLPGHACRAFANC